MPMQAQTRSERDVVLDKFLRLVDIRARAQLFSGVIHLSQHGEVLIERAYGLADREAKVVMTTDAKLRIGSVSKLFTSVAALQLVEAGKLTMDLPIAKVLDDYPNRDLAQRVTIRHLLTHTGGTGDAFLPQQARRVLAAREHADYIPIFGERGVDFEPGTRFEYSNYGFILLALIIERVTGQSYYDYVREHVFARAEMPDTDSVPESTPVPRRVVAYRQRGIEGASSDVWECATESLPCRGTAAGFGYSTVRDLVSFMRALQEGKLISPELLKHALTRSAVSPHGLGFFVATVDGRTQRWGHNGGAHGQNSDLWVFPQRGYLIAVLSNLDPPSANFLAIELDRALLSR